MGNVCCHVVEGTPVEVTSAATDQSFVLPVSAESADIADFRMQEDETLQEDPELQALSPCRSSSTAVPSMPILFEPVFQAPVVQEVLPHVDSLPRISEEVASKEPGEQVCPPRAEESAAQFEVVLRKAQGERSLGINLKQKKAELIINKVYDFGPAHRVNEKIKADGSDDFLQPGFEIVRVNDVEGDPSAMVNECKARAETVLVVADGPSLAAVEALHQVLSLYI
eukprot:CAMPEP_0194529314 /NCGR_PEP_ID=MMETSP0253-20130528/65944_1 /TAXON_ID=2966 /ORGANISM="Noctiluca scintillans" /LENGTH=224 /DNA_ID=CAMNT_0039374447 /DNA_START=72 /DNA_END=750 /DNA_ORIENTATION=-